MLTFGCSPCDRDLVIPPPPEQSFASDNAAGAHDRVIEALQAANVGASLPYGDDPWTRRAAERFRALFEAEVEVFYTYGGTGANVVALQCLLAPHEAVICPTSAHINVDECGAPERFTGAKLIDVPSSDGKLSPDAVRSLLQPSHDEHHVTPRVVAISQPTELGTLYTVDEIGELAGLAHEHGLVLYVDGARIANAVAALGCSVRELTCGAGVDVLTFGGTKNGLLYGEAVVFLRPELARRARFARKQAGQLASKMRFIAAQFDVLLQDGLWLAGAAHANEMAKRLASAVGGLPQVEIARPVEVNSLFARLSAPLVRQLQDWSFFWTWDLNENLVRWMTSFATGDEDVTRFAEGVRYLANQYDAGTTPAT
jgi:threonine aldolase